jgi:hypothetical protein
MSAQPVMTPSEETEAAIESAGQRPDNDMRHFLTAIAAVLGETVSSFENTVSRITEITVMQPGKADRDLVVVLQEFDRLHQEFSTLGQVLGRLGAENEPPATVGVGDSGHPVLAAISIADLKQRLARHLSILTVEPSVGPETDEAVF